MTWAAILALIEQYGPLVLGLAQSYNGNVKKWIQGELNNVVTPSPHLRIDGIIGPKTIAAVELFQTEHHLVVDGIPGLVTQALLVKILQSI